MRLGPVVLFSFIAIPIAEIWILITVGGIIGVVPTIVAVVLTAVAGTALIRHQGMGLIAEARRRLDRGEPPVGAVVDGAFLLVAGALLLTPGFLTDAIGFLCLVPVFRRGLAAWVWSRYGNRFDIRRNGFADTGARPRRGDQTGTIIEGEFIEVDAKDKTEAGSDFQIDNQADGDEPDGQSPWAGGPRRR
ncbi:FxsA protein [hydrothermal vent metagenome]|uniref:FxsA protein n=1 Tax=hydrothermal vent metagenome TaxID=652676 RepID=A0A3B0T230_9ZZZZ